MRRATRALLSLATLALTAPAAATDLRIPPLPGGSATVRLVLAADTSSQVLGWVASEWADVLPARLSLDTEQVLSLDATSAIATATGAATCYLVSISAPGQRSAEYCVQLPDSIEVQELADRVGATAVPPDSLIYTLTADERAALDAATDPSADNPLVTLADFEIAGAGDMQSATYDPQGIVGDAFDLALHTGSVADANVPDTITINFAAAAGTASTAGALAANGANCAAGSYALGVDTAGAAEGCTDATTEISSLIATHAALPDVHHAAVTVLDTATVDLTLLGQRISADVPASLVLSTDERAAIDGATALSADNPVASISEIIYGGLTGAAIPNATATIKVNFTGVYTDVADDVEDPLSDATYLAVTTVGSLQRVDLPLSTPPSPLLPGAGVQVLRARMRAVGEAPISIQFGFVDAANVLVARDDDFRVASLDWALYEFPFSAQDLGDTDLAGLQAYVRKAADSVAPLSAVEISAIDWVVVYDDPADTAAEISVAATPANYTPATPDVEAHLAGLDTAIGGLGGGHDAVTLAGEDYLSLSGQQITANAIDAANLAAADFGDFTCNGTTCTLDSAGAEVNDLTAAVTWATIPDANVPDDITLALESASLTALADDEVLVGSGAGTGAYLTLPDCGGEDFTLGYSAATNAWVCNADAGAGGGMTSWTLSGDTGTPETITDGNTVDISGDASGIDTAVSATDTVTISFDPTEAEAGLEAVLDLQDLQGAVTDAQVPDTVTITLAATATALAANGTNCAAGSYPLGVNASGAAESCTDATTEIASLIATHAAAADPHTGYLLESAVDSDITTLSIGASASVSGANTGDQTLADFTGTLTDGRLCTYDLAGGEIDCDTTAGGTGDVVGPASATDNALARFDGTTGKLIQSSGLLVSDLAGDEVEIALADVNDSIHIVTDPTSDTCGVLIADGDFTCPTNTGTYSLYVEGTDNGVYQHALALKAGLADGELLHFYSDGLEHLARFNTDATGEMTVQFTDTTGGTWLWADGDPSDPYLVLLGASGSRQGSYGVTITDTLAVTGDPADGDGVANRDYNDARYAQPSGTITDNCALRADGTTGRLNQCSAVAISDTADVQTAGYLNAEIRAISSTDATVTVNAVDGFEENGTLYINADNDAQTLQLPAVEVGDAVMLVQANGSSGVLCLSPDASDYIIDAGTRGTVGTDLCSSGAATDLIAIVGISADEWRVVNKQGTWSE